MQSGNIADKSLQKYNEHEIKMSFSKNVNISVDTSILVTDD